MKPSLFSLDCPAAALILASGCFFALPASGQPAALPSGYGHMGPPPAVYGTQMTAAPAAYRTASAPSAPKVTSTPKKSSQLVSSGTSSKDREQDQRISRLQSDVASLRNSGGSRFISTGGGSSTLKASTTHVVKPGDSLWAIANQYRVSPGEIIALNRMKSETVSIGQSVLIPGRAGSGSSTTKVSLKPYYHDVRSGDTSSTIAKKYDISRQSLMDANTRVDFGAGLIPGSRVVIPGKSTRVETSIGSGGGSSSSSGGSYTVKSGDSLKGIAIRHGTTTATLMSLNSIKDANKVLIGQRITLPGGKSSSAPRKTSKPASNSDDTTPLPGVGLPVDPPAPVKAPNYPDTTTVSKPAAPKPSASTDTDSHRGVLAYRVDSTDTIENVATQFSTTPQRIREMNHLQATTKLQNGDEIMVPALGAVSAN